MRREKLGEMEKKTLKPVYKIVVAYSLKVYSNFIRFADYVKFISIFL